MGMAASQARLLSLTSRLSDLEYRSQVISNEKQALSRQSQEASDNYIAALDSQIIKVVDNDDNSKITATAANLTTYNAISSLSKQRMLKTTSGKLIVSQDIATAYESAKASADSAYNDPNSDLSKNLQQQVFKNANYTLVADSAGIPDSAGNYSPQLALRCKLYNDISGAMTKVGRGDNKGYTYNGDTIGLNVKTDDLSGHDSTDDEAIFYFMDKKLATMSAAEVLQQMYATSPDGYNTGIANTEGTTAEKAGTEITGMLEGLSTGEEEFLNQFNDENGNALTMCYGYRADTKTFTAKPEASAVSYYENLFEQMAECDYEVISDDKMNDSDWLNQQLTAGNIYLSEKVAKSGANGEDSWQEVSWTSGDTEITTVDDTTGIAKAEAEYEATTAKISSKDERYDLQLKNIDTEHSAVQTEVDSVKKVIDKNIERSFKIFDA